MKIQSIFFGKEIFGRNVPYNKKAIEDLPQLEVSTSIVGPISLEELENFKKSQK